MMISSSVIILISRVQKSKSHELSSDASPARVRRVAMPAPPEGGVIDSFKLDALFAVFGAHCCVQ